MMGAGNEYELDEELKSFVEERLGYSLNDSGDGGGNPDPDPDDDTDDTDPEFEETDPSEDEQPPEVPDTGEGDGQPTEPPSLSDGQVELAPGVTIPREQALSYAQFDALLRSDPELFRLINETVQGRTAGGASPATPPTGTGAPTSSTPPELPTLDEDSYLDPNVKALYDTAKAQREYIENLDARLRQLSDVTITRDQEELRALITSTRSSFQSTHTLSDTEMEKVAATAERLNVLPGLLQGIDPITGQSSPRDRSSALTRAFDIAYNFIPEFKERAVQEEVKTRAKSTRRKQRLAGVSGSGGSVPRQPTIPTNDLERRNAMIAAVAEAMGEHRPE